MRNSDAYERRAIAEIINDTETLSQLDSVKKHRIRFPDLSEDSVESLNSPRRH